MANTEYLILASDSNNQMTLFGTRKGHTFASEASARRAARRLDGKFPHLDFLALPIEPLGDK